MTARAAIDWSWRDGRLRALAALDWGPSRMARALGVKRPTLIYRMETLQLRAPVPSRRRGSTRPGKNRGGRDG